MAKKKTADTTSPQTENATIGWDGLSQLGVASKEFFKPEDGKTARVRILSKGFHYARVQYIPGFGYFKTLSKYDTDKFGNMKMIEAGIDVELLGKDPALMFCLPVIVYDTNKSGGVTFKTADAAEYTFKLWSFYERDATRLAAIAAEWGDLSKIDLIVTGEKSGKYVNAVINPANGCVCKDIKGLDEQVMAEFEAWKFRDVEKWIAREVTEKEVQDAVAKMENSSAAGGNAGGGNVRDSLK